MNAAFLVACASLPMLLLVDSGGHWEAVDVTLVLTDFKESTVGCGLSCNLKDTNLHAEFTYRPDLEARVVPYGTMLGVAAALALAFRLPLPKKHLAIIAGITVALAILGTLIVNSSFLPGSSVGETDLQRGDHGELDYSRTTTLKLPPDAEPMLATLVAAFFLLSALAPLIAQSSAGNGGPFRASTLVDLRHPAAWLGAGFVLAILLFLLLMTVGDHEVLVNYHDEPRRGFENQRTDEDPATLSVAFARASAGEGRWLAGTMFGAAGAATVLGACRRLRFGAVAACTAALAVVLPLAVLTEPSETITIVRDQVDEGDSWVSETRAELANPPLQWGRYWLGVGAFGASIGAAAAWRAKDSHSPHGSLPR